MLGPDGGVLARSLLRAMFGAARGGCMPVSYLLELRLLLTQRFHFFFSRHRHLSAMTAPTPDDKFGLGKLPDAVKVNGWCGARNRDVCAPGPPLCLSRNLGHQLT